MMKDFEVLCAGLIVMDVVASGVNRSVFERDTTHTPRIIHATGGDALNVAINLAGLGARVCISGAIGDDLTSVGVLDRLRQVGVSADNVQRLENESTAISIVLCTPEGERHFIYNGGANDRYDGAALSDAVLSQASILFVGSFLGLPALDGEALISLTRRARALGLITVLDACGGSRSADKPLLLREILPHISVFFPSEEEAEFLSEGMKPEAAARYFVEQGALVAGVKMGARGCYLTDGRWKEAVLAIPCAAPVDTTGAGDAFMSGFIRGLTLGEPFSRCARLGIAMGSQCIRSLGATTHGATLASTLALTQSIPGWNNSQPAVS